MIDLDANATTRLAPEAWEAMLPWLRDHHGNPSSSHRAGREARKAIETAREQVADLLQAHPDEIVFTSGGTESVNTALWSLYRLTHQGTMVTSPIEHSSVLKFRDVLPREPIMLPIGDDGRIQPKNAAQSIRNAAFVSAMWANNETGVVQPIAELCLLARETGVPFHTDAVQAAGKISIDVRATPVDMLSISAHKFHGPKGIGALYVRSGLRFHPLLVGGGQENGRRSGTENTAAIVGMGAAAALARAHLEHDGPKNIDRLRCRFESQVMSRLGAVIRNGHPTERLCNTSHMSFHDCDAAALLILLDQAGVACSAGSACMSGKQQPSHVQMAMGIPKEIAKTSIRFSLSRYNNENEIDRAVEILARSVSKLRSIQGAGVGPVSVYTPD